MLDSTVVNLALPAIQQELGATSAELQWVMNGYLLTIAAIVVTAGRFVKDDIARIYPQYGAPGDEPTTVLAEPAAMPSETPGTPD